MLCLRNSHTITRDNGDCAGGLKHIVGVVGGDGFNLALDFHVHSLHRTEAREEYIRQ